MGTIAAILKTLNELDILSTANMKTFEDKIHDWGEKNKKFMDSLDKLGQLINQHATNRVSEDQFITLQKYTICTKEEIETFENDKKNILDDAIRTFDTYSMEVSEALIYLEAVSWKMEFKKLKDNPGSTLNLLSTTLEQLKKSSDDDIKDQIRKEESIKLEERKKIKIKWKEHCNHYKIIATQAYESKNFIEKTLTELNNKQYTLRIDLKKNLDRIPFNDSKTSDHAKQICHEVCTQIEQEIGDLFTLLSNQWVNIYNMLGNNKNTESLTYDLNRLGVAIKEKNFAVPARCMYNSYIPHASWTINTQYVESPWHASTEQPEKAKTSEATEITEPTQAPQETETEKEKTA